jgi:hypothetical protein
MKLIRGTYCKIKNLYFWKIENGKEKWVSFQELQERKLKVARQARELRTKNPEREKFYRQKYYYRDINKSREYSKEWRIRNLDKRRKQQREYNRKKREHDPLFLIKCRLRVRMNKIFRVKKLPKTGNIAQILGCSWEELRLHIENQFLENMNWENRHQWHIDHIIPLASAKSLEEVEKLCHYTNLQPLWAFDNMSKGAKLVLDNTCQK